jgi:HSP20 family molecular chaperone IbpA
MAAKRKSKGQKDHIDIQLGKEKPDLAGVLKQIGKVIDSAAKSHPKGESEFSRTGKILGLGTREARAVYGFSIKVRKLEGRSPRVGTSGSVKREKKRTSAKRVRKPSVDLVDEAGKIRIIAQIPGTKKEKIKIKVGPDVLELKAAGSEGKYSKKIPLPSKVKKKPLRSTYRNGVLRITLGKAKK